MLHRQRTPTAAGGYTASGLANCRQAGVIIGEAKLTSPAREKCAELVLPMPFLLGTLSTHLHCRLDYDPI